MKKLYGMSFKEYKNRLSITILLVALICFTIGTMTGVTIVCAINDLLVETEEATTTQVVAKTSVKEDPIEHIPTFNKDDLELVALVTMAEAEGENEYGKRLVIDTILNRVESRHFPNTIREVIYQPNQFTSMWNGRINRCSVDDEICQLVMEEFLNKTNDEVIFFRTNRYSDFGTPLFKVGNHYFSKY